MNTAHTERTYHFGAPATSMLVSLDAARAITLMASLVVGALALVGGQIAIAAVVMVGGTVMVLVRPAGVPLVHWAGPLVRYAARPRRQTESWPAGQVAAVAAPERTQDTRPARRRHRNPVRWPQPLNTPHVGTQEVFGEPAGVLRRPAGSKMMLTTVLWRVELPQSFPLLAASDQVRLLDAWGGVLASAASRKSPVRRVSVVHRQVPDASNEARAWATAHASDADLDARRDYLAMIDQIGAAAATSEVIVGLTLSVPRKDTAQVCSMEAEQFAQRMEAAGFSLGVFSKGDVGAYLASVRDGTPLGGTPQSTPAETGPLATEDHWDHIIVDGRRHRTYTVAAWPRLNVGPTWLEPLLTAGSAGAIRTTALHFAPVPIEKALRSARTSVTAAEMAVQKKQKSEMTITTADRQARADAERREQALSLGHAEHTLVALCSVSVPAGEDLAAASGTLEHSATLSHIAIRPCYARQGEALVATMPFGLVEFPTRLL